MDNTIIGNLDFVYKTKQKIKNIDALRSSLYGISDFGSHMQLFAAGSTGANKYNEFRLIFKLNKKSYGSVIDIISNKYHFEELRLSFISLLGENIEVPLKDVAFNGFDIVNCNGTTCISVKVGVNDINLYNAK